MLKEILYWAMGEIDESGTLCRVFVVKDNNPFWHVGTRREVKNGSDIARQRFTLTNLHLAEKLEENQWYRILVGDYGDAAAKLAWKMHDDGELEEVMSKMKRDPHAERRV